MWCLRRNRLSAPLPPAAQVFVETDDYDVARADRLSSLAQAACVALLPPGHYSPRPGPSVRVQTIDLPRTFPKVPRGRGLQNRERRR